MDSDQLQLSLRAWPRQNSDSESLPFLISRINAQRGSFRNVTEQSLEEEIRAQEAGEAAPDRDNDEAVSKSEIPKSRREELIAGREEIMKQLNQAQTECAYALDFVSLILSKHTPRQAEIAMSLVLKQSVPMGSLGAEMTQLPQKSPLQRQDDQLVSTGWKLQSLNATADSLLRSATRLEREMEEEAKYWEQVLAIKEKGWSICRLPRERHTLGVRYGFAEAAPSFRDRGLAALRRGENGEVDLDLGIRTTGPQVLRVRIQKGGQTVASSIMGDRGTGEDENQQSILRARNSIFDEELHHELYREARIMANRGVRCVGDTIRLPFESDEEVVFDLVSIDESQSDDGPKSDSIAHAVSLTSRLLLSNSHRQNLQRRSQVPAPLTERRPPRQIYAILRPILAQLQHREALGSVQNALRTLQSVHKQAGLVMTLKNPTSSFDLSRIVNTAKETHSPLPNTLINSLTLPLTSSIVTVLPTYATTLTTQIRTHFLGTDYRLAVSTSAPPDSALSTVPRESHFTSSSDLEDYILHLVTLDIVSLVVSHPSMSSWSATSPHIGLLTRSNANDEKTGALVIRVSQDEIELRWSGKAGELGGQGFHSWGSEKNSEGEKTAGLFEVIESLGSR